MSDEHLVCVLVEYCALKTLEREREIVMGDGVS